MKSINVLSVICVLTVSALSGYAGELNPPAPPSAGGTMKTLDEVEPRIPVNDENTPGNSTYTYIINQTGSYYLTGNITSTSKTGIKIEADNVTLDLSGYTISFAGTGNFYGIYMSGNSNIEVRNGIITGFNIGINDGSYDCSGDRIISIKVTDCKTSGILLYGDDHLVKDCYLNSNGNAGALTSTAAIKTGENSIISGNTITNTGSGTQNYVHCILAANNCIISDNTIKGNGVSSGSSAYSTRFYGINASYNCKIQGNTVIDNAEGTHHSHIYGIYSDGACQIIENSVRNNGVNATASGNTYIYGISAPIGSNVIKNVCTRNGYNSSAVLVYGISAGNGCNVANNSCSYNGTDGAGHAYGIYTSSSCNIRGNAVYNNGDDDGSNTSYGILANGYSLVDQNVSGGHYNDIYAPSTCVVGSNAEIQ